MNYNKLYQETIINDSLDVDAKNKIDALRQQEKFTKQKIYTKDEIYDKKMVDPFIYLFDNNGGNYSFVTMSASQYLDGISGYARRLDPMKTKTYKILEKPLEKPAWYKKVENWLAQNEKINIDPKVALQPYLFSPRYYADIYKYRKVLLESRVKFQLEYTGEIVDDLWLYIMEQEFKRVNPNTVIKFKWVHHTKDDFIDGYNTYVNTYTDNSSIRFEYNIMLVQNMIHKLRVLTKLNVLMVKIYPTLRNFPKYERYGLAAEIRNNFVNIMATIEEGASCKSIRKQKYQLAIGMLHTLNQQFLLAENMRYMSIQFAVSTRLAIGEIISMVRKLLQAESSSKKDTAVITHMISES